MSAASADLRQLAKDLDHASGMGIKKASQKVVKDTAYRVQNLASGFAPVDTGLLSRTILIRFPDPYTAVIYPQQPYGVYQEFGTGERGEFAGAPATTAQRGGGLKLRVNGHSFTARPKGGSGPRGVAPQPFMRPAAYQALKPAAKALADAGALLILKGPRAA